MIYFRETSIDKMGLQPNSPCVSVFLGQYEHFHTIPYNPVYWCRCRAVWTLQNTLVVDLPNAQNAFVIDLIKKLYMMVENSSFQKSI